MFKFGSYLLVVSFFLLFLTTIEALDQSNSTIDPYKFLHIIPNPNGTITRLKQYFPTVPPNISTDLSYSKDTLINLSKITWVRTYLPKNLNGSQPIKLPIIVYVHGGGFIVLSAATPNFDSFCAHAASRLGVLLVSVEYRLAPEHRLPAAYEDVLEALDWVKNGSEEWVAKYGDVSRCIIMGESAGGNIAYNVGLRASHIVDALKPLVIRGLVLIQPFFGGMNRSGSEIRLDKTKGLPFVVTDLMWNSSLPIGADRDHVYCNPFVVGGLDRVQIIRELGWPIAVAGRGGDPLFDRQVELVEWLKKLGVNAAGNFSNGDYHGVFVTEFAKAESLFQFIRNVFSSFISEW